MRASVGQRVRLAHMSDEHLQATRLWLQDARLRQQVDSLGAPGEGHRSYWNTRLADERQEAFAILEGNRHVGNCGLRDIDRERRKAELWMYLGEHRGLGVGSAALTELVEHAFGDLDLHRVYLRVLANNDGAQRFYRRFGFVEE